MADALDRLIEALLSTGLDTTKDGNQVPTKLREMLAVINDVTEAKLKKDLAPAVRIGVNPLEIPPIKPLDVPPYGPGGRASASLVTREDIVTLPSKTKEAITVGDLIDEAQASQGAMARLLDEYIRLVIREEVKSESLESSGGESGTAADAAGVGDPAGTT